MNFLTVYKASAGSGKTTELTTQYILLALQSDFRKILGITFTNKATAELKERIIMRLFNYSKGKFDVHAQRMLDELNWDKLKFEEECGNTLQKLLFNYGLFSISTIDSFFQKIIKSFAREAGIQGNVKLELDHSDVIKGGVDKLLEEAGKKSELTKWLSDYSVDEMESGRSALLDNILIGFGAKLFNQQFKIIKNELQESLTYESLIAFKSVLTEIQKEYQQAVSDIAQRAELAVEKYHLSQKDFVHHAYNCILKLKNGVELEENQATIVKFRTNPENWSRKGDKKREVIIECGEKELNPLFDVYFEDLRPLRIDYNTATQILKKYNAFGISVELLLKMKEYKAEEDIILLDDSAEFLKDIIGHYDSPFIYEKVGNKYDHYLIDEFQDTSIFQWNNLKPLVENTIAQGYKNFIVGDVKQSIYRWRGGDWSLLESKLKSQFSALDEKNLSINYRSAPGIIRFNNDFFSHAIQQLKARLISNLDDSFSPEVGKGIEQLLDSTYNDISQEIPTFKQEMTNGRIELVSFTGNGTEYDEQVLGHTCEVIENLQLKGVKANEIAILVNKNKEGVKIAEFLMNYASSKDAKPGVNYQIVSNDALQLVKSPAINLIMAVINLLVQPGDSVSKMVIYTELELLKASDGIDWNETFNSSDEGLEIISTKILHLKETAFLSITDLIEGICREFELDRYKKQWTFIYAFLDEISQFNSKSVGDLPSLQTWWETKGKKMAISISEQIDAINIITIHKSKGLEFKAVLIPYCIWGLDSISSRGNTQVTLWGTSNQAPFNHFPYYLVDFNKGLRDTHFWNDYINELINQHIDSMNVLYVAFTRAIEYLHICYDAEKKNSISELIANWNGISEGKTEIGPEIEVHYGGDKEERINSLQIDNIVSEGWNNRIVLSKTEKIKLHDEVFEKIELGESLHEALYVIFSSESVGIGMSKIEKSSDYTDKEKEMLKGIMSQLYQHPETSEWFNEASEMNSEVTLLDSNGKILRPDLIISNRDNFAVIDFKSGEKQSKYLTQISRYRQLLEEIEKKKVEALIIYLQPFEVVKVN